MSPQTAAHRVPGPVIATRHPFVDTCSRQQWQRLRRADFFVQFISALWPDCWPLFVLRSGRTMLSVSVCASVPAYTSNDCKESVFDSTVCSPAPSKACRQIHVLPLMLDATASEVACAHDRRSCEHRQRGIQCCRPRKLACKCVFCLAVRPSDILCSTLLTATVDCTAEQEPCAVLTPHT